MIPAALHALVAGADAVSLAVVSGLRAAPTEALVVLVVALGVVGAVASLGQIRWR